jgi:glycerol-3-phosphate O-acyltransferase
MPVNPIRLISFCSALQEADGPSSLSREELLELHHMLSRLLTEVEQAVAKLAIHSREKEH